MPRKRKVSMTFYDDEDLSSDSKCGKEDSDSRAPRNAANARERARMRVLSKAFCRLKTTLPWVPADTKLSKLDTLRLAATYIAHLRAVLRDDADISDSARSLSLTLSWPFALQNVNPALTSNNCSVSSTSMCSNSNQYRSQHQYHETQNYDINNYQNTSARQNNYDNQLTYY